MSDILDGLPESNAASARQILEALALRGALRKTRRAVGAAPGTAYESLSDQLSYIDHYTDDGEARLAAYAATAIEVVGDGSLAAAVVSGLLANGAATLACDDRVWNGPTVQGIRARRRGLERASFDAPAVRIYADLGLPLRSVAARSGLDAAEGIVALTIVRTHDHVLVGPLSSPGTVVRFDDVLRRFAQNADDAVAARLWRRYALDEPPSGRLSRTVTSIAGNLAAFEVFKAQTGSRPPETRDGVVVIDVETLVGIAEQVLPVPHRFGVEAAPRASGDAQAEPGVIDRPGAWMRPLATDLDRLIGRFAGILIDHDDLDIMQSPLKIGRVRIATPGATERVRSVVGWSIDSLSDARSRASIAAVETYCASQAAALSGEVVPASRLRDGQTVSLPSDVVFAASGDIASAQVIGQGAGGDPMDATVAAARDVHARLAMRRAIDVGASGVAPIDPATDDDRIEFLQRSLEIWGVDVRLYSVTSAGGVDVVLASGYRDEPHFDRVVCRAGASRRDAAAEALGDLLARLQTESDDPAREPSPAIADLPSDALAWIDVRPTVALDDASAPAIDPVEALLLGEEDVHVVDVTTEDVAAACPIRVHRIVFSPPAPTQVADRVRGGET